MKSSGREKVLNFIKNYLIFIKMKLTNALSIDKIMFDPNNPCLFCNSKQSGLAAENDLAYVSYDTYPVSEFHCLIIPKRHVRDYFDLNDDEVIACNNLIKQIKEEILLKDPTVKGFNIGTNAGAIAGQSVLHCHIHLIPRREGDVDNPQGGVRSVIPLKQHYKRKV